MKFQLEIEVEFTAINLEEVETTESELNTDPEKLAEIIRETLSLDFDYIEYQSMEYEVKQVKIA